MKKLVPTTSLLWAMKKSRVYDYNTIMIAVHGNEVGPACQTWLAFWCKGKMVQIKYRSTEIQEYNRRRKNKPNTLTKDLTKDSAQ